MEKPLSEDDDDEDEVEVAKATELKLIDFAHAGAGSRRERAPRDQECREASAGADLELFDTDLSFFPPAVYWNHIHGFQCSWLHIYLFIYSIRRAPEILGSFTAPSSNKT